LAVPTPLASTSDARSSYALTNGAPTAGRVLNYLSQIVDDHHDVAGLETAQRPRQRGSRQPQL